MIKFLMFAMVLLGLVGCSKAKEYTYYCATPVGVATGKGSTASGYTTVTTESGAKIRIAFTNCVEVQEQPQ